MTPGLEQYETYHVGVLLWIGDADVCEFNVQILKDKMTRAVCQEMNRCVWFEIIVIRKLSLTWSTEWRVPQMLKLIKAEMFNNVNANVHVKMSDKCVAIVLNIIVIIVQTTWDSRDYILTLSRFIFQHEVALIKKKKTWRSLSFHRIIINTSLPRLTWYEFWASAATIL